MQTEARKQFEKQIAALLRDQIDKALRAPGYEDVLGLQLKIAVNRIAGTGPDAQFQFAVSPSFAWQCQ